MVNLIKWPLEDRRCSKGWGDRCAKAKNPKCTCACGGQNHGTKRSRPAQADLFGGITTRKGGNMRRSNYTIVEDVQGNPLVIRDIGPWNQYVAVTNNAEDVVEELVKHGKLPDGRRLFYYDTEGQLDELLVKDGRFDGFVFAPRSHPKE